MKIGPWTPNSHAPVLVIAEIGSNHGGDKAGAFQLINEAAVAGAGAVKFQLFRYEDISNVPHLHRKEYELDPNWIGELAYAAHLHKMAFLCTPFSPWAVEVLEPHVDAWKIGSFEALDPILLKAIPKDKVILMSLGMVDELQRKALRSLVRTPRIFMHCVSQYPTPMSQAALWRLKKLDGIFGYSSHTEGWNDVVAAVALGAQVIEKHFMGASGDMQSPDSGTFALRQADFTEMCYAIKEVHSALRGPTYREGFTPAKVPYGRKLFGS